MDTLHPLMGRAGNFVISLERWKGFGHKTDLLRFFWMAVRFQTVVHIHQGIYTYKRQLFYILHVHFRFIAQGDFFPRCFFLVGAQELFTCALKS